MGKYLRRCRRSPPLAPPATSTVEFTTYLQLRSGRRVPTASSGGLRLRRRRSTPRCSSRSNSCKPAAAPPRAGRKEEEYLTEELSEASVICQARRCRESKETTTPSSKLQHEQYETTGDIELTASKDQKSLRTALIAPPEAEVEGFFAAAELAERRRFAETYNYDVALDCPLEGRFEWVPLNA